MDHEYWLDLGSGIDAEHWTVTPATPSVRRVALDPLLTSGMIGSGRLTGLPDDILRLGGELRPEDSVEAGKEPFFLPFREAVFSRVHCGFVLHLYLELLGVMVEETYRVLIPAGKLEVLLPHFGDSRSEDILRRTRAALEERYGSVREEPYEGPFTTFWADLYRDKTWRLWCSKAGGVKSNT